MTFLKGRRILKSSSIYSISCRSATFPILYLLNTTENLWFSTAFRGFEMGTLSRNVLRDYTFKNKPALLPASFQVLKNHVVRFEKLYKKYLHKKYLNMINVLPSYQQFLLSYGNKCF